MPENSILPDLMDLSIALASERKIESVMNLVLEASIRLSGAEGAAIYSLDTLAHHLHRVSSRYRGHIEATPDGERIPIYGGGPTPNLSEPASLVVSTGAPINIGDVDRAIGYDFSRIRKDDDLEGIRTQSLVIVPLTVQENRSIGILQLINVRNGSGETGALDEGAMRPLISFASQAAVCMWNSRLVEENSRLNRQFNRQLAELPRQRKAKKESEAPKLAKPGGLVGDSPPIEHAISLIGKAAVSDVPILLRGETGTGKEMMASFIHQTSDRNNSPFVVQNCAALPESLLESELFGHVKGAFTGAATAKQGLAHEAHKGTLFLDEIGDMPLSLQAKVLRLLQEGEVRRVGSTKTEIVDVRIVGATNVHLEKKISDGEFRKDLYYRLNVFPIQLPPLRERPSDIPKLIDHFLKTSSAKFGKPTPEVSSQALEALLCWSYPGNVRELKNILDRARLMADEGQPIQVSHLPGELAGYSDQESSRMPRIIPEGDLKTIVGEYEALVLEAKMREANWNKSLAARILKVSRRTIIEKLNRYNISRPTGFENPDSERP